MSVENHEQAVYLTTREKSLGVTIRFCRVSSCRVVTFKGESCPGCGGVGVVLNELRGVGIPTVRVETEISE